MCFLPFCHLAILMDPHLYQKLPIWNLNQNNFFVKKISIQQVYLVCSWIINFIIINFYIGKLKPKEALHIITEETNNKDVNYSVISNYLKNYCNTISPGTDLDNVINLISKENGCAEFVWLRKKKHYPTSENNWLIILSSSFLKTQFWECAQEIFGLDALFKISRYR